MTTEATYQRLMAEIQGWKAELARAMDRAERAEREASRLRAVLRRLQAPEAVSDEIFAVDPPAAERPPEAIRAEETP